MAKVSPSHSWPTVYGVASANLICLPIAGKIGGTGKKIIKIKEMTLKGVLLIQEGINHSIIEEQLKGFSRRKKREPNMWGRAGKAE